MVNQNLNLRLTRSARAKPTGERLLGQQLVEQGTITPSQLVMALHLQQRQKAWLGEILVSLGWTSQAEIQNALTRRLDITQADLDELPPDAALARVRRAWFWQYHRAIPWMRMGSTVFIATARPDQFDTLKEALSDSYPNVHPVLVEDAQIVRAISDTFGETLAREALTRVPESFSCRTLNAERRKGMLLALAGLLALTLLLPAIGLTLLIVLGVATLCLFTVLKLAASVATAKHPLMMASPPDGPVDPRYLRQPRVSVLVPLYKEKEIANALIRRLSRLTYPKALLEVLLVLEEDDDLTKQAIARCALPPWIRVIEAVGYGDLRTKPRAMNYALDFCRGDIVGIWDAEDAPMPDQIDTVVRRFNEAGDDVACLQGILDYYNPRQNWLARCFTIEYGSWFRVVLPGIARLGLVVPLGGTTLFMRRDKLKELGGWDAHNVTEDADLGVRLCRAGYRTEMIGTVTHEEANCRVWPWIKQRSRWLKGFMITYLVHMRSPRRLWRDLGAWKFLGFQAFFTGTILQFLLAPLLWLFWLVPFGVYPKVMPDLPDTVLTGLTGLFIFSFAVTLGTGFASAVAPGRRHLLGWVPSMMLYFPLGTIAAYKALYELVACPWYWDKTQHDQTEEDNTYTEMLEEGPYTEASRSR